MDRFLEEQLKRIQDLASRMSGLEHRATEITEEIVRGARAAERNPLREVRDLRAVTSPRSHPRAHPHAHAHTHDALRRRRRRKRS